MTLSIMNCDHDCRHDCRSHLHGLDLRAKIRQQCSRAADGRKVGTHVGHATADRLRRARRSYGHRTKVGSRTASTVRAIDDAMDEAHGCTG